MFLFELQQKGSKPKSLTSDPTQEVFNYGEALRKGQQYLKDSPLSLKLVLELHKWLLDGVRGENKSPGGFRSRQIQIGSDARYVPPPVEDMAVCLENLEQHIQMQDDSFDPLVRCYLLHYQFEAIHPFRDGNGRVGRLLLALMTGRWCGMSMPWLYMSSFFEKYKDEYVSLLFNVSAQGDWTEWIQFCLRGTIHQAKDAIRRCELLINLKEKMHGVTSGGSGRLHGIVDRLFVYPVLTIPMVANTFGVKYPTAKSDIDILTKTGILQPVPDSKNPKVFFSTEIFKIAYTELDED